LYLPIYLILLLRNPLYQESRVLIDEQRQIALFKEAQRLSILPNGRFLAQMRPIRKSIYYSLEEACAAVPQITQPGIELVSYDPQNSHFPQSVQKIKKLSDLKSKWNRINCSWRK